MSDSYYLDPVSKKLLPVPADEGFEIPACCWFGVDTETVLSDDDVAELAEVLECPVESVPDFVLGGAALLKIPERLRENYRALSDDEFWALVDL